MKSSKRLDDRTRKFLENIILWVNIRKVLRGTPQSWYCQRCEKPKESIEFSEHQRVCRTCLTEMSEDEYNWFNKEIR